MMFVDTHTHFFDEWLLPDAEAAIQRATDAGVGIMIQADVDSRERPAMWEIGNRHPGVIYEMLGLYPGSVAENWREELDLVHAIASKGYFGPHPGWPSENLALPGNPATSATSANPALSDNPALSVNLTTLLDQVQDTFGPGPIISAGPGPADVPQRTPESTIGGPGPGGEIGPGPKGQIRPGPGGEIGPGPKGQIRPGPGGNTRPSPGGQIGLGPSPIVAIGEIGLDYHEGLAFVEEQKEVLRIQLELAARMNLPVNIHLRDAWEDLLSILADCKHLNLRGNLHCFTASYEIYERANRYGDFSVGIGGVVTFKNSKLAKTLERIPLEKILLETDAPYLAPVPYRGRRNESAYLPLVAEKVAEIKGVSLREIEEITTENAKKLFNL